jgi:Zn ribbon nucleic-acid-binding protein
MPDATFERPVCPHCHRRMWPVQLDPRTKTYTFECLQCGHKETKKES